MPAHARFRMTHRRARSERTNAIITNPVQHHASDRAMNPTAAGIGSGKPRSHRAGAAATKRRAQASRLHRMGIPDFSRSEILPPITNSKPAMGK
jgi:hypothetical protein